jgi:hypothetical protein
MIGRIAATMAIGALAGGTFWVNAVEAGHLLDPLAMLLLLLGGVVWFAWRPIRAGFGVADRNPDPSFGCFRGAALNAMLRSPRSDTNRRRAAEEVARDGR